MPLLSIIIPNYNYGRFFYRIAHALNRQTLDLRNVELILADDGSTDDSREQAATLSALSVHSFTSLWLDHCGCPGSVRNAGLERASGQYLLCLDPDDIPAPGYLEACIVALKMHSEADISYTDFFIQEDGETRAVALPDFLPELLAVQNILPPAAMMHRKVWEKTDGYRDNTAYEDWDLWVRAAHAGFSGIRVGTPLFTHMVHGENFSFDARQDDARAKAAIVLNTPEFFAEDVCHWARGIMAGESWAESFPRGLIPRAG